MLRSVLYDADLKFHASIVHESANNSIYSRRKHIFPRRSYRRSYIFIVPVLQPRLPGFLGSQEADM